MSEGLNAFLKTFKEAYERGEECDIEIYTEDQKFKAIKFVLCLQSSFFKAMFSSDTEENRTNVVKVNKEFTAEVVQNFLLFLHTGELPNDTNKKAELFKISDYYGVGSLREISLKATFSTLSAENALDCYQLAEKFNLSELKTKAVNILKSDITCSNFYERYVFAHENSIAELKAALSNCLKTCIDISNFYPIYVFAHENSIAESKTALSSHLKYFICGSNFYQLHVFASENSIKELELEVTNFLKAKAMAINRLDDWKRLPADYRLEILEAQNESVLVVERVGNRYRDGPSSYDPYRQDMKLKNNGSSRLAYKILIQERESFHHSRLDGFIEAGEEINTTFSYRIYEIPNTHNLRNFYQPTLAVFYEFTDQRDIDSCFKELNRIHKTLIDLN